MTTYIDCREYKDNITNGHLLICDWCFRILTEKCKVQTVTKDVVKSEV